MEEMKTGTCLFPADLTEEERQLLVQKIEYLIQREDLPLEVRTPKAVLFDDERRGIGYTYEEPDFPGLTLKELFQKEKMEQYHVDGQLLFQLAKKVLYVLMDLSSRDLYPGIIDLSSIQVHEKRPDKAVFITRPEHFQAGEFPSTFPWYPSDSLLFQEDLFLFNKQSQKIADAKLIYKILTASEKGNAKIPPNPRNQELSYVFWNILSREWKDFYLSLPREEVSYEYMLQLLSQSIEEEKYYTDPKERRMTEEVHHVHNIPKKEKAYAPIVILRKAGKSAHDISRQLYLLQEKLEEDQDYEFEQAFILGDRHVFARDFRVYARDFKSQLAHKISSYSFGEALLVAAELTKKALERKKCPVFFYILLDGEILNDSMYQKSLEVLKHLKEKQKIQIEIWSARAHQGEGYQKLLEIGEEKGNFV